MTTPTIRAAVEAHANACREALEAMRPLPVFDRLAELSDANLRYADLSNANLSDADLSYANLRYADLSGADLSDADLSYADLSYADLLGAELRGANLSDANLSYADLSYADLSGADLSDADLSYANLRYADLSGADLSDADLSYADLRGANLPPTYRIASLCFGGWSVTVTPETTAIGCQRHPNADWLRWTPDDVAHMHDDAKSWWTRHRESVCAVIRDVMQPEQEQERGVQAMTDRLTDDELSDVRKRSKSGLAPTYREVNRLLDEIEERRRAERSVACSDKHYSLGHRLHVECELPVGHVGLHLKTWGEGNSCSWLHGKDGGA